MVICGKKKKKKARKGQCSCRACDPPQMPMAGLPWWAKVKNPPSNGGDSGSVPGQETKIPCAAGPLSLWATTTELASYN